MAGSVLRTSGEGVATISINRPAKHNALDDEASAELTAAMAQAIADPAVRCVVVRGEGPSFCAGRDTGQLGRRDAGDTDFAFVRRAQDGRLMVLDSPKPVIAAVQGHAIGGGCEIALAADFRIAATNARFSLPEIRYGLVPDTGGHSMLTSLIGPARAKLMVMTGDPIDAATALAWGLVEQVVEPADLDATVMALATRLAASPPLAISLAKQLVDEAWATPIRRGMRNELTAQVALFASEDYAELKAARLEGRPPELRGS